MSDYYYVSYLPCKHCGYNTGKSIRPKNGKKRCLRCGGRVERDFTDTEGRLFSGENNEELWVEISNANSIEDLRYTLYIVCRRLQELEDQIESQNKVFMSELKFQKKMRREG